MRILYFIQCHRNLARVEWLARTLLRGADARVLISVDESGLPEGAAARLAVALQDQRVAVYSSIRVTWSGATQVESFLHGLRRGLALLGDFEWDYFINLSGECFPMKSARFIDDFLAASKRKDVLAMLYGWKVNPTEHFIAAHVESPMPEADFSLRGVRFRGTASIARWMNSFQRTGICPPPSRNAVFAVDDPQARSIFCRPLTPAELKEREQFFAEAPHYCGRAWFILHRDVCDWIATDELARRGCEVFSSTIVPDESYIPTLLLSDGCPFRRNVGLDNYRMNLGAPSELSNENLPELTQSAALYGRKLTDTQSQAVIDWVDTL